MIKLSSLSNEEKLRVTILKEQKNREICELEHWMTVSELKEIKLAEGEYIKYIYTLSDYTASFSIKEMLDYLGQGLDEEWKEDVQFYEKKELKKAENIINKALAKHPVEELGKLIDISDYSRWRTK